MRGGSYPVLPAANCIAGVLSQPRIHGSPHVLGIVLSLNSKYEGAGTDYSAKHGMLIINTVFSSNN